MDLQQIAAQVTQRVQVLRLSPRTVAARGGPSHQTVRDLQQGKRPPTADTQRKIAAALSWPIDWVDRIDAGDDLTHLPGHSDDLGVAELRAEVAELREEVSRLAGLERVVRSLARVVREGQDTTADAQQALERELEQMTDAPPDDERHAR